MGSGHDWQSDEEIVAEEKKAAERRASFQKQLMDWYDNAIRNYPPPLTLTSHNQGAWRGRIVATYPQAPYYEVFKV